MRIGSTEPRMPPPDVAAPRQAVHPEVAASGGHSAFSQLVHGLGTEINRGEAMMRGAVTAAHDLGPTELIALQAGVYRYSETIDLASRLVDHATGSIKTVVQGGNQ